MNYVIGDIHGCYSDMIRLIENINIKDSKSTIYFLGDFIDRGPQSWETFMWAINHISDDGKYQAILGNHEDMLLSWIRKYIQEGSNEESLKYGFEKELLNHGYDSPDKLQIVYSFLNNLDLRRDIDIKAKDGRSNMHFIITHAWAPEALSKSERESKRKRDIYLWERQCEGNEFSNDIIVHGHTPTIAQEYSNAEFTAEGLIGYRQNAINLDGGPAFYRSHTSFPCMLCGICLETLEEFYPMTVQERFNQYETEGLISSGEEEYGHYRKSRMLNNNFYREELLRRILY